MPDDTQLEILNRVWKNTLSKSGSLELELENLKRDIKRVKNTLINLEIMGKDAGCKYNEESGEWSK